MAKVYAAIGSNIASESNIENCLNVLKDEFSVFIRSSYYITSPYGYFNQNDFLNLVVGLSTMLTPGALLGKFQEIEHQFERVKKIRDGPRTIDLDILLYDSLVIKEPNLMIPHPGLLERDFFLIPMLEVAPQAIFPCTGGKLSKLAYKIRHHHIIRKADKLKI